MAKKSSSISTPESVFEIRGIVRDHLRQPMPKITVRAYHKTIRSRQLLGETTTTDSGSYTITYTPKNPLTLALVVCVYNDSTLLMETAPYHDVPALLQADIDLSNPLFVTVSEYDQLNEVINFLEDVPLSELTETEKGQDISFITQKTGISRELIEKLVMAARFESFSSIPAPVWYAMLQENLPTHHKTINLVSNTDFEATVMSIFDALMHTRIHTMMNAVQKAIDENIVSSSLTAELPNIRKQLIERILGYAKKHPATGSPSTLHQKLEMAGLKGKELQSFIEAQANHTGTEETFWNIITNNTKLKDDKNIDQVKAVFNLSGLTGSNLALTEKLISSHNIKSPADIKKLAGYNRGDWEALLNEHTVELKSGLQENGQLNKKQYAAQLESNFTKAFPTTAFVARSEKDKESKLPHREKINKFLKENEQFDLLQTRVGHFMKENKHSVDEQDAPELEHHLRRTQRVFKLAPTYDAAHALLSDNIHSAQQVAKMGKDNFVRTYSGTLGEREAVQVFEKASEINARSVAFLGDLQSMVDASPMNAFPDFSLAINQTLIQELPSLETLFGHTDFAKTDEARSVYGVPAYLTDMLHFLDQRQSTLPLTGTKIPSVKDLLLKRRPDIADIDLESNNANIEVPYIDIACELMEDFITSPVSALLANTTHLPKLVKGPIDPALLSSIKGAFTSAGRSGFGNLLTAAATVSDKFTSSLLAADNTYVTQDHWIIRDSLIAIKVTNLGTNLQCRALHQTLLSTEAINAGTEYVNTKAYDNFLKTAKRPFTLPFDLFESEGELYLEKLGIKKADLIDTFRNSSQLFTGNADDIAMACASFDITEAERALIFNPDNANQTLYWGPDVTGTTSSLQVNVFERISGLSYQQIEEMVSLSFMSGSKIEHDDLSSDTTKQRITSLTQTKFDMMHRLLRLWRKTNLSLSELNSIRQSLIGMGNIDAQLVWRLQYFTTLQQRLGLSASQLMTFYDLLPRDLYDRLFQNSAITNPIDPDFSFNSMATGSIAITAARKSVVAAGLQISLADLELLMAKKNVTLFNSNRIALLYRHTQLAQSLQIPMPDFLTLLNLIDVNPFANVISTYQFTEKYNILKSSDFSIADLNYILRHQNNAGKTLIPTADQVLANLSQLQNELMDIKTATTPAVDTNGALLTKWLSDPVLKWDSSIVNRLIDILSTVDDDEYQQKIIDNTNFLLNLRRGYQHPVLAIDLTALPITIPASIAAQLSFDPDKKQLTLKGVMSAADRDALLALSTDAAFQAAINSLFSKILTSSADGNIFFASESDVEADLAVLLFDNIADRFDFFIGRVSPVYVNSLQRNALVKHISTWFNMDKVVVNQLLLGAVEVFTDFTASNFINKIADSTPGNPYPVQANRYQFIAKTFFLIRKLNLPVPDMDRALKLFLTTGPSFGCINFRDLPLAVVDGAVSTFPGIEAVLNLLKFHRLYPTRTIPFSTGGAGVYNVFGVLLQSPGFPTVSTVLAQWKSNLAFAYGWNESELNTLLTLNITTAAHFTAAPAILLRLHSCFTVMKQLGISLADAQSWCAASLTSSDSAKIKNVLKAKHSHSDWPQVSKPLQDTLREKKRDALISYLLANPGNQTWNNANDLYSHFLLDVEMCSCQPTSRIVEATNAVQLFVQRCFLNLEDSVAVKTTQDSDWLQWKWMKNFRVWQANLKVFLYPENWVEPELLPDEIKSSFLKELENELLQNEVTARSAEDAFENYLEKLEAVARLEVKGTWYDQPSRTLHVIARTYGGNPRIYYHRRCINDKRWTPWTKIDLDITGDHVIPAVYNNRLYLFWAIFTEIADNTNTTVTIPPANASGGFTIPLADTKKNWQIQLAFSEYKNGKWTPKVISENNSSGQIVVPKTTFPDKSNFFLAMVDVPNFDYSKIFDNNQNHIDTQEVFNQKAAVAIRQNGKLVVSCYYYNYVANNSFDNNTYVGSFQLDSVKGFPTHLSVNYKIQLQQATSHIERSNRKSIMRNMIDSEVFTGVNGNVPPTNGIPGSINGQILVADQAGGPFGNTIPLQLDLNDRYNYMNNIYNNALSGSFSFQCQVGSGLPYFYQDQRRNYYVVNEYSDNGAFEFLYSDNYDLTLTLLEEGFQAYLTKLNEIDSHLGLPAGTLPVFIARYFNFHHPLVDYLRQRLFANGIDGFMERDTQLKGDFGYDKSANKFDFQKYFQPVVAGFDSIYSGANLPPVVHDGVTDPKPGYPKDDVDFNLQSGYGLYNWELFFHAPLMIAERLSQNQQFEEAEKWYRYIFNPMDTSTYEIPNKFWNTKPFFLTTSADYINQRIENILKGVNETHRSDNLSLVKDVADWRDNPFQPHFIAQSRTVAYQKTVVMKYVAHLIRHADNLFRQHTRESVNEATQLYILASEVLGPKPAVIPSPARTAVDNYYQLEQKLDALSNALVDVENLIPFHTIKGYTGIVPNAGLPTLRTMYFSIPMNENLVGSTGYWDVVADRLFKIRHCSNIDGTFAPLSLFAPPIDPGVLVRASAAGLDIGSILTDINAPLPSYRFMMMIQKATELCNEVKTLGTLMLSALEKKDAETFALLRSGQEIKLMDAILTVKQKQVEDAKSSIDILGKQKELILVRQNYYSSLLKDGLSISEKAALTANGVSLAIDVGIAAAYIAAGGFSLIPQFVVGASGLGSPVATASAGGQQAAAAADHAAKTLSTIATAADKLASIINTNSNYQRRAQEWQNQLNLADKEMEQIEKQLLGAQIRLEIANQDLANHQLQIEHTRESNDFMHDKFTNEDLFNWMRTQVSDTYFKSYQLAYDVAKQTERCFRYELAIEDSGYINFGYWDNLKKGLLAGERLLYDIKRMEIAYYEQNKRELELTKHVSLSQLDPVALLKLKTTGECWINFPEEIFDMDYPGHYMRRIKSVSLTIPCIAGPYTTVSCKLTMTKNSVRKSAIAGSEYSRRLSNGIPTDDPRFRDSVGSLQSIATSSGQNDSGLFELNFRDERYLPFEGAGAISLWHLELPAAIRQFDYETISDVIIHVKYTARDGGDVLKASAATSLNTRINQMLVSIRDTGLMRIFSAKHDLPTEWYKFLHPANATDDQVLTLNLDKNRFPLFAQNKTVRINLVELVADCAEPVNNIQVVPPEATALSLNLTAAGIYGSHKSGSVDYSSSKKDPGTWLIKNPVGNSRVKEDTIRNMAIIVHYEIS